MKCPSSFQELCNSENMQSMHRGTFGSNIPPSEHNQSSEVMVRTSTSSTNMERGLYLSLWRPAISLAINIIRNHSLDHHANHRTTETIVNPIARSRHLKAWSLTTSPSENPHHHHHYHLHHQQHHHHVHHVQHN